MAAPTTASPAPASLKDQIKQESERITVFVIVFLGLVYGFFFLPDSVLNLFKMKFSDIGKAGNITSILAGTTFSGMVAYVLGKIIMAQDVLATTDLKWATFFRGQYPSTEIKSKYGCGQAEADYLWFLVFNPWKEKDHPRYLQYVFTLQRDYSCRFIFHTQCAFVFFTILGGLTWLASWAASHYYPDAFEGSLKPEQFYSRVLLLAMAVVIIAFLFAINRMGKGKPASARGCWARFVEINDINKQWLRTEILDKAGDYPKAMALVQSAEWLKKWGSKDDKQPDTLKAALQHKLKEAVKDIQPHDLATMLKDMAKEIAKEATKEPPKA
jgi:membrane protein DedA with SNARE-associated domain